MSTAFLSGAIWPSLTKAVKGSRQRCVVSVAYFGSGAGRLLPLRKGSRLVVDASERAVASGQTSPAELMHLSKRGVAVYSVPNLHAKVFVLGRVAYIGSTNVSNRSAGQLVEAVIRTTDSGVVRSAREFVNGHCLHELTPEVLKRLDKLYRPPQIPGGKKRKGRGAVTAGRPTLPRLLLAQLHLDEWSDDEQQLHDSGLGVAKKRREHPRSFELDSFIFVGKSLYKRGDVVIQVTDEGSRGVLVTAPGNVLHVRKERRGNREVSCIYVERPSRPRRSIKAYAAKVGRGASKRLKINGVVREVSFAHSLLEAWSK